MATDGSHTPRRGSGESLIRDLAELEAIVDRIATADIAAERLAHAGPVLGSAALRVHGAVQRLAGKRLQWLMAEEADGRWALTGARTYATHVAQTHRITQSAAKADVRLARQFRDEIQHFDRALRAGEVGLEQARIVAAGALTSQERIAALGERVSLGSDPEASDSREHEPAKDGAHDPDGSDDGGDPGQDDQRNVQDDAGTATVEEFLLAEAMVLRPAQLRHLVHHFARVADPEADERGYRKSQEREYVDIARTLGGFHLAGFLTEEHGQQVRLALDAVMGKPVRGDARNSGQRRAQGLADMARVVLDQGLGGTSASVRPHVGVHIGAAEFARLFREAVSEQESPKAPPPGADPPVDKPSAGLASSRIATDKPAPDEQPRWDWNAILRSEPGMWTDATGPVPTPVLRRMARCGDVYRVLFSAKNEVLNQGRAHRTFTAAQRRAIVARDRHCVYPGCTAPPVLCETHHALVKWSRGGTTDVANGALLCFHHHDLVEARRLTMARPDGAWRFYRPDGTGLNDRAGGRLTPWKKRE
ncbi:DUF222 domain-containing protein [Pseudactinotalea sp. Z1732]|uniref:HNH endonuclease n=1 Tax=Micrococcales TaxID=85006 RepID=UPI003C7DC660